MRYFISLLMIILCTFWLPLQDLQAKRFGGGRSFGINRGSTSANNFSNFSRQPFERSQIGGQRSFASKWLGPLAGLVMGGLLATLFMQNGLGSGLLTWIGIGLAVLFLINLFRKKMQPATQSYQAYQEKMYNTDSARDYTAPSNATVSNHLNPFQQSHSQKYPIDFDKDAFLRDAKVQFIRLQSAYDQKNLNDLREFTTPEVYAEVQLQLNERGDVNNQTIVVHLDAELLEVSTEPAFMQSANSERTIASVRFTGKIREELNDEIPLNETWHFVKAANSSRWVIAGVQQH